MAVKEPEVIRISNSSTKTVYRCEQRYVYKYVEGLSKKLEALPLKLGSWLHSLLEHKYKDGDWKPKHKQLSREFRRLLPEEREYYGDLPTQAKTILLGYEHHWRLDEGWKIIDTEVKVEVKLGKAWVFVGKIDVVAEDENGDLWLWDHKSFKGQEPPEDYRIIDPQSALYVWAYERITGRQPVGFVFNYLRTKLPSLPQLTKRGVLSKRAIDTNEITFVTALKHYGLDPKDFRAEIAEARSRNRNYYDRQLVDRPDALIRNLLLDIKEKSPRIRELHEGARPTRTLTKDCRFDCEFFMLCLTEVTGGNGKYIRKQDFVVRRWEELGPEEEATV